MKPEKITSCLITAGVAFCMSFGAVSCVATGLDLSVDLLMLAFGCLLLALLAAGAYTLRYGGRLIVSVGLLSLALMVTSPTFMEQLKAIGCRAMTLYSQAYGFAVPEALQGAKAPQHFLPLLAVAGLIVLVTAWIMLHRYPASLAVFTAILPLISCFIITDTVPQIWCLVLWLFGIAMLTLTQTTRIRDPKTGNRLAGLLALPLILGLTLLSWAVPRKDFKPPISQNRFQSALDWVIARIPFVGQTSDGRLVMNFVGDLDDTVDLEGLDDRKENTSTVLEVTADWTGKVYLRIRDYDVYTGTGWKSSGRTEKYIAPPEGLIDEQGHLEIHVLGNREQLLVPYYASENLTLEDGVVPWERSQRNYSFDVVLLDEDWAQLWREGVSGKLPKAADGYSSLPADTYDAASQILSEIQGLSGMDTVAAAEAIGDYVSAAAEYSYKVDTMPEDQDDFAIWFLEDAEEGYCVHFATAATVLLRARGIPARFVEGYLLNGKAGVQQEVEQDSAHAWVEYYVEGAGWMVLDPTPAVGQTPRPTTKPTTRPTMPAPTTKPSVPVTTKPTTTTTKPAETATKPSGQLTKPTASGSAPTQSGTLSESRQTTEDIRKPEPEPMPTWLVRLLIGLAVGAVTLAAVVGQWILRRWRKLRRMASGTPNRRVIARYREARRICRAVKADLPKELEQLAEKAGYSQHTLSREELAAANTAFAECFALLEKGRWYQKLIWRFVLALY